MKRLHIVRIFVLLISLVALLTPERLAAQGGGNDQEITFRLAQSYERGGDYEAAVKLYEQLYAKDPANIVMFDALRRLYLQLKRYDEAITLLEARIEQQPNDVGSLAQLGSVYMRTADEKKAVAAWDRALAVAPKSETTYRIVTATMTENRLFDRAVSTYERGRKEIGTPSLFTADLAYLYSLMLKYDAATREYLNLLRENAAQLGYVQSRISAFTGRPEGLSAATTTIEEASTKDAGDVTLLHLLAWLYMEGKQFDKAFTVYERIDKVNNARGMEIFNFAERALREKAYAAAARAFTSVMSSYPSFERIQQAKFGYALTLEASSTQGDTLRLFGARSPFDSSKGERPATEAEPQFTGVIAAYERIVADYPKTEVAARSLVRIADLMYERSFNLDAARAALVTIEKEYAGFPLIQVEAKLRLGDVALAQGDIAAAAASYEAISSFRVVNKELREKATFRLAEVDFFRAKFADAVQKLQGLMANTTSDVTNDALSLQILIQSNLETAEPALKEFAAADFLKRQHKLSEALAIFESIRTAYAETDVIDETLMNIGDVLAQMKRYPDAVASFERLAADFPESIVLDRALMKIGEIYQQGMHDAPHAITAYQSLLERFPTSIYANEARTRIRDLRGDTL